MSESAEERRIHSFCRICQSMCGTVVTVKGIEILKVQGDIDNPASLGYTCAKGRDAARGHHGEDRLDRPMLRQPHGELAAVDWDTFLADAGSGLSNIVKPHGPGSVAVFRGTHYYYDSIGSTLANAFASALGTRQIYSPRTIDMLAKVLVPHLMLGSPALLEQADWDNTQLLILVGVNIVVSHGHTASVSQPLKRMKAIKARGGHIIAVDPRNTETTKQADVHLAPRPGTDAALMAFLVRSVLESGPDTAYLDQFVDAQSAALLPPLVDEFTVDRTSVVCGLAVEDLLEVQRIVLSAGRLSFQCGTGATMSEAANVVEWLGYALTIVTGSLDRVGGTVFNPGFLSRREDGGPPIPLISGPPPRSRPDASHTGGEYPCAVLADEILAGEVRALVVIGGNPMRQFPNTAKLERALRSLDLLLVLDVRETQTTALASHVAAVAGPMERWDIPLSNDRTFTVPYSMVTQPIVPPVGDRRTTGWVVARLAERMGLELGGQGAPVRLGSGQEAPSIADASALAGIDDPAILRSLMTRARRSFDEVVAVPSGITADEAPPPGWFVPDLVANGRIDLTPDPLVEQWIAWQASLLHRDDGGLRLINRRLASMANSVPTSADDPDRNGILMHPKDAVAAGVQAGDQVVVSTTVGEMTATVELTDGIRPGVVAVPPGCSGINNLSSSDDIDSITGMTRFTAVKVDVRKR